MRALAICAIDLNNALALIKDLHSPDRTHTRMGGWASANFQPCNVDVQLVIFLSDFIDIHFYIVPDNEKNLLYLAVSVSESTVKSHYM